MVLGSVDLGWGRAYRYGRGVAGGVRVAQIVSEETGNPVVLTFQTDQGQRGELEQVLAEEKKALPAGAGPRAITMSKVCRYMVGLGLDLYRAREELGAELDAFAQANGLDRRGALLEALRRGVRRK